MLFIWFFAITSVFGRGIFCSGREFLSSHRLPDLPSQKAGLPPFELCPALRTIRRGVRYHSAALGTVLMPGLVKVKQRFPGQVSAAAEALQFIRIRSGTADGTYLGLLHHFRTEAQLLHSHGSNGSKFPHSVSHCPHHLRIGVWLHSGDRSAPVRRAASRIEDSSWGTPARARTPRTRGHRRYTSHPSPTCRISCNG